MKFSLNDCLHWLSWPFRLFPPVMHPNSPYAWWLRMITGIPMFFGFGTILLMAWFAGGEHLINGTYPWVQHPWLLVATLAIYLLLGGIILWIGLLLSIASIADRDKKKPMPGWLYFCTIIVWWPFAAISRQIYREYGHARRRLVICLWAIFALMAEAWAVYAFFEGDLVGATVAFTVYWTIVLVALIFWFFSEEPEPGCEVYDL